MKKGKSMIKNKNYLLFIAIFLVLVVSVGLFIDSIKVIENPSGFSVFSDIFNKITGKNSPNLGPTESDVSVQAGNTYYIDYVSGSDSNDGLTKNSPWKLAPGMTGFTRSYSHSAGDRIIFKGGVTWPASTLPLVIRFSGSLGAYDYYGVDKSWFNGASFSRPVFDGENSKGLLLAMNWVDVGDSTSYTNDYIMVDGIEFIRASYPYIISLYNTKDIIFNDIYIHNWNNPLPASLSSDDSKGVLYNNYGTHRGSVTLQNSIINNFDGCSSHPGYSCGGCLYGIDVLINNNLGYCAEALLHGGRIVAGNTIHDTKPSFMQTVSGNDYHDNTLFFSSAPIANGATSDQIALYNNILIYNNTLYNIATSTGAFYINPSMGENYYIYNNLLYNLTTPKGGMEIDCSWGTGNVYVYENTFHSPTGANLIRGGVTPGSANDPRVRVNKLAIQNNHFITSGSAFTNEYVVDASPQTNNLIQTPSQAASDGYTLANMFKPTSSLRPTVNNGTLISCASCSNLGIDLLGISRPQLSIWDIGAYEYSAPATCTNCKYVTPLGTGDGSSWSSPAGWNSVNFLRNYTYYLSEGTYSGKTLSTSNDGTKYITIKKATASNHGTDTGWSNTMGDEQAQMSSLIIDSSNWIIDGQTGEGFSTTPPDINGTNYGITFPEPSVASNMIELASNGATVANIFIGHVYMPVNTAGSNSSGAAGNSIAIGNSVSAIINNVTISHSYFDGWGQAFTASYGTWNDLVWEYNIYTRMYSTPAAHGNPINFLWGEGYRPTIRYSLFYSTYGNGGTSQVISANGGNIYNAKIYGNVFDQAWSGLPIISGNCNTNTVPAGIKGAVVYSNTFLMAGYGKGLDDGGGLAGGNADCSNNIIFQNNLAYYTYAGFQAGVTPTYNTYISTHHFGDLRTELGAQVIPNDLSGSVGVKEPYDAVSANTNNPFVDYVSHDYRLKTNTAIGNALGTEYFYDALGNPRTTWTRGAFEYVSGSQTIVNGQCSSIKDQCLFGNLFNSTSNSSSYLWNCLGQNGGSNASCSQSIPIVLGISNGSNISITQFGTYTFNITQQGVYKLVARINNPSDTTGAFNSFYVDLDNDPLVNDSKSFDFDYPIAAFSDRDVSWRGSINISCSSYDCAQYKPKNWTLSLGLHTLYIGQRESLINQIQSVKFIKLDGANNLYHPADLNTDLAVSLNEFTNYSSYFKLAKAWPIAPSPPDANYYSRAYFLLKRGITVQGAYSYNSSSSCPSCFIVR